MEIESSLNYSPYFIKGLCIITPQIHKDKRGFFFESWNIKTFNSIIQEHISFYQDNHSSSLKGVIRDKARSAPKNFLDFWLIVFSMENLKFTSNV